MRQETFLNLGDSKCSKVDDKGEKKMEFINVLYMLHICVITCVKSDSNSSVTLDERIHHY
jgi:hypothetical protein